MIELLFDYFFFSSRRRHTRSKRDWSSDVCSSDLNIETGITLRFKDIWRILFTNKELLAYIGVLVTFFLSIQILGNVAIYYFSYVAESKALFALYNGMGFMEIIALLLFPKVSKWITRK